MLFFFRNETILITLLDVQSIRPRFNRSDGLSAVEQLPLDNLGICRYTHFEFFHSFPKLTTTGRGEQDDFLAGEVVLLQVGEHLAQSEQTDQHGDEAQAALQGLQAMGVDVNALLGTERENVGGTQGYLASLYRADETAAEEEAKTPTYREYNENEALVKVMGLLGNYAGEIDEASRASIKASAKRYFMDTYGLSEEDAAEKANRLVETVISETLNPTGEVGPTL